MSKFKKPEKVKLTLVVAKDEADKTAFTKTLFPADIEVKTGMGKIISVADYKHDTLYVFKKASEGGMSLVGFDDCHEVQLTQRSHQELLFYSKVAALVQKVEEKNGKKKVLSKFIELAVAMSVILLMFKVSGLWDTMISFITKEGED